MNRHFDPITYPPPSPARAGGAAIYDEGLRRHMLGVYRNMALGLGITALVALLVASTPALYQPIFGTPLKWVAIFAPLAFVLRSEEHTSELQSLMRISYAVFCL